VTDPPDDLREPADFAAARMFDFQISEAVAVANEVLKATRNRDRDWFA